MAPSRGRSTVETEAAGAVGSAGDAPSAPLLVGRYRLGERLGRGSSATVFAATDDRLERDVVVKLLEPGVATALELRARFRRQTTKAARLRHPQIVALLDAGFATIGDEPERPFVVMERAGSTTLRQLLDRQGRLAPGRAVAIARQVATALAHAHGLGVIHADVKPENVIVDEAGERAKLTDFSLSFVSALTGAVTPETIARRAAYLAPEQVAGDPPTPATDVYAVGVLLYELVVGRPPFVGKTPEATASRRVEEAARPIGVFEPSVPSAIETIVDRALERAPARRWATAGQLAQALHQSEATDLDRGRPGGGGLDGDTPVALPEPAPAWTDPRRTGPTDAGRRPGRPRALLVGLLAVVVPLMLMLLLVMPRVPALPGLGGLFASATAPEVTGLAVEDARARARAQGVELVVVGDRVTERLPRGVVVQQSPVAGFRLDGGQSLRVTVSAGVTVPDVRGKSLVDATAELAALGWTVGRVERAAQAGAQAGTVIVQHPAPGGVAPGPGELAIVAAE